MQVDSQQLLTFLNELGITTATVEHPPLRTLEDSRRWRSNLKGAHAKNLFLKDKKGGYWLLAALEHTTVDLRNTAALLQAPRFSFAHEEELQRLLGIAPGAVSPLAAINDAEGHVCIVLDQRVLDTDFLNCHPLRNDRTTTLATADLVRFLEAVGHPPRIIHLPG